MILFMHKASLFLTVLFLISSLFIYESAHAQPNPLTAIGSDRQDQSQSESGSVLRNPLKINSIEGLFAALLDILVIFATPVVIFFIIYSGFLYVTAQGNEEQLKKARVAITWTIIGGLLVLGASLIADVLQNTVNALR